MDTTLTLEQKVDLILANQQKTIQDEKNKQRYDLVKSVIKGLLIAFSLLSSIFLFYQYILPIYNSINDLKTKLDITSPNWSIEKLFQ